MGVVGEKMGIDMAGGVKYTYRDGGARPKSQSQLTEKSLPPGEPGPRNEEDHNEPGQQKKT